jgi:hypothetical protein
MTAPCLYRQALATGIITLEEIDWLADACTTLPADDIGTATQLVRLLEQGVISLGCRLDGAAGAVAA